MWIAIVYEQATTVIEWNVKASQDEAVQWVIDQFYPKDAPAAANDDVAFQYVEAMGYVVQIEEAEFMPTDEEYGLRFPDGHVSKKNVGFIAAAMEEADTNLRKAGSPDRVVVVSRAVLYTDWKETYR
jgi:hypothetical protein